MAQYRSFGLRSGLADRRDGGDDWNDPLADIDFEEFELNEPTSYGDEEAAAPSYAPQPPALVTCPSCGAAQPATNLHCEQCGARLSKAPLPVAPRPLANVTAGTRALTVILAVLAGVVILALGFQIFGGNDEETAAADGTPAAGDNGTANPDPEDTTATTLGTLDRIPPIKIECSSQYNDTTLACANLIDGDSETLWNDSGLQGVGAVFTVTFAQPVALQQLSFTNVEDEVRFQRNYRINGVEIVANDLPGLPIIGQLPNENTRDHVVVTQTLGTTDLVITVVSTYPAQVVGDRAFDELALGEIEFWGRVVETTTPVDNTNGSDG